MVCRIEFKYSWHTLSDIFLSLKNCVTKGKCVTQGMSVRFIVIPWVTHMSQNCVTKGKFNAIFPLVTHFWEICVTQGVARNLTDLRWVTHFPLVTQLFSAKKCVTQGMSTVYKNFHITKKEFVDKITNLPYLFIFLEIFWNFHLSADKTKQN